MTAIMANELVLAHMPALALHIAGGGTATLAGYAAALVAKGERLHRLFGKLFVAAMALMAAAAIYLAGQLLAFKQMEQANIAVACFVLYLIATGWMAVKRPPGSTGRFERGALAWIVAVSAAFFLWGARAAASGSYDGYGPTLYVTFGGVAALFAALDIKLIVSGSALARAPIARHLGRMCTAWFIACSSFFLGQQKVMPAWMHGSKILLVLAVAPLAVMLFWLVRVRIVSRFKRTAVAA